MLIAHAVGASIVAALLFYDLVMISLLHNQFTVFREAENPNLEAPNLVLCLFRTLDNQPRLIIRRASS